MKVPTELLLGWPTDCNDFISGWIVDQNPMMSLIYLFFLISITVLGHFIQVVSGCLRLVDSKRMEQVSVRTQIHMLHTPKESTDPRSQNQLCKKMLFQQQKKKTIAQRWKQTPSQLLFFCLFVLSNGMMIIMFITISTWSYGRHVSHTEGKKKKEETMQLGKSKWKWRPVGQSAF